MLNHLSVLLSAAMFIMALFLPGCGKDTEAKDTAEIETKAEKPNIVRLSAAAVSEIGLGTTTALRQELHGVLTVPARLLANQDNEAQVGSLVQGRVQKVFVRAGSRVSAGQPLMSLASLEVGEIQSDFIKARANLVFTEAALSRQKTLYDQKIGSQKALLDAQSEYDKAVAELNSEDKKIHSIGLTDKDVLSSNGDIHSAGSLIIKAPISGVVVERNVVVGQLVDNSTTAFRILNTSSIWAEGQIYEKDAARIAASTGIRLSLPPFPDETFSGRIIYIGQVVDQRTRTIAVRAELVNPSGRLKPEMFGQMDIPAGGRAMGILIPSEGLVKENKNDFVFVRLDDSTFEKRLVETGLTQGSLVEITRGVNPGDLVVTKGVFYLKSEMLKSSFQEED